VALTAVCVIVFICNLLVNFLERRLLRWRPPSDVTAQKE
jgi:hypothetical protein